MKNSKHIQNNKNMKPMLFRPNVSPLALLGEAFMKDLDSTFKTMSEAISRPNANILENDGNYQIELSVPGFGKEDIQIEVENGHLVVSSEVKTDDEKSDKNYRLKEFTKNSFKRTFNLKDQVNTENISANLDNGVLTITLDKKEEVKPENKKVEIK